QGEVSPAPLPQRRPEPPRHLGPRARRPRGGPRRLPPGPHRRAGDARLRAPAAAGPPGEPLHRRPQPLPRRPRPRLRHLPAADLPPPRLADRRSLLHSVEDARRRLEARPALLEMDASYRKAYELLASPRVRRTFDLGQEPTALRDHYGRHRTGQACLLARRLV